jgi:EF-P beta-lysylation protein EpmB
MLPAAPLSAADSLAAWAGPTTWQEAVRTAVRDVGELVRLLNLPGWVSAGQAAAEPFELFVPRGFLARMRPGDPHDPLLLQVLPVLAETRPAAGYVADPVGDADAELIPGLLKKYAGRALLIATGACAVHCRYCFRRHFPYHQAPKSPSAWNKALEVLARDATIHELLLSGGDPLMLSDARLAAMVQDLEGIAHLRRLRVHTRLPIVIPQRVCRELTDWLTGSRLTPVVVVHANHPAEIDDQVAQALGRLIDAGVPVLNQAVLLKGVNDDADVLTELCEKLIDLRVMPYYLHQLDRVAGAAQFEVPVARGLEIMAELRRRLPGYAVPRYVREEPGMPYKYELR